MFTSVFIFFFFFSFLTVGEFMRFSLCVLKNENWLQWNEKNDREGERKKLNESKSCGDVCINGQVKEICLELFYEKRLWTINCEQLIVVNAFTKQNLE